ncbi:hypothetical protein C8F04DRAFT_1311415 [Mycena alexandri]|uniref:Uncharacterized protein n=1 Tax=Mycena alexandri TaxID=1745969 RepID=A0AAD6WVA1_9AGAR|nr:hypothetical protein C8F04DRAFT_1311415 [Mycena alexandri]
MSASGSSSRAPQQHQFVFPSNINGSLSPLDLTPDLTMHGLPQSGAGQQVFSWNHLNHNNNIIQSADHDTLMKHENTAYTNLLKKYNELYTQHNMLISAYSTLANAIPQIFHYIPNPMQIPIPPPSSTSASVSLITPAANSLGFDPFSMLDAENFPDVRYWMRKNFSGDDVTEIDASEDNEKGGKLGFLEHITGTQFTPEELKYVRKHAYTSFADLLEDGTAPQKWSQASATTTTAKEQIAESSQRKQRQSTSNSKRGSTEETGGDRKRAKRDSESREPVVKDKNKRKEKNKRRHRNRNTDEPETDIDNSNSPRTEPNTNSPPNDLDDIDSIVEDENYSPHTDNGTSRHELDEPTPHSPPGSPQPRPGVVPKPNKITLSNPLAKAKSNSKGKGREVSAPGPSATAFTPAPAPSSASAPQSASGSNTIANPTIATPVAPTPENTAVKASAAQLKKKGKPYKPGDADTAWNLWAREQMLSKPLATGGELRTAWNELDQSKYKEKARQIKKTQKDSEATVEQLEEGATSEG